MATQQLEKIGEQFLINWLQSHGYYRVERQIGGTNIEADGSMRKMLVHLIIAQAPHRPNMPQANEVRNIKSHAASLYREPWVALMRIDTSGQIVENVQWFNLAK